jgi:hypothetical protein
MAKHFVAGDQLAHGDVVVQRFAAVPSALKQPLAEFKTAHAALAKANTAAGAARGARDDALEAIGAADDALDAAVRVLADKLVGAGMGARKNAFAGLSSYAPGAITELAYATEIKEVLALCARITKAKPAADVAKAVASCVKLAGAVTRALAALSKPQLAYTRALAARDGLLPGWTKALQTLRRMTQVVLDDDAATKALFAPPERVQDPKKKRPAKKAAANGATATGAMPAATVAPGAKPSS